MPTTLHVLGCHVHVLPWWKARDNKHVSKPWDSFLCQTPSNCPALPRDAGWSFCIAASSSICGHHSKLETCKMLYVCFPKSVTIRLIHIRITSLGVSDFLMAIAISSTSINPWIRGLRSHRSSLAGGHRPWPSLQCPRSRLHSWDSHAGPGIHPERSSKCKQDSYNIHIIHLYT